MNTQVKRFIIIMGSIVLAAAIVFGTLALIKVNPAVKIADPDTYYVLRSGTYSYDQNAGSNKVDLYAGGETDEQYKQFKEEYKSATRFGSLRGIFDGYWFPKAHLETFENEDGEDEVKTYAINEIKALSAPVDHYMVVAAYDISKGLQSVKIDGVEIEYNRVYFFVSDSAFELKKFDMYLVNSIALEANDEDFAAYKAVCLGDTSDLYELIVELV